MNIVVTGGAGFIGSTFIRTVLDNHPVRILNLDKLTYAANLESLSAYQDHPNYQFVQADICDSAAVRGILSQFQPDAVIHLAAESHVDRSIDQPADFMHTNVMGTYCLLEACRDYWASLTDAAQKGFRFLHVSTDEVYGDLPCPGDSGYEQSEPFTEQTAYAPNSPYSASKAASDHLVKAWYKTYGMPILMTHCSNNYGPHQFPEKLIPVVIRNAINGQTIPIYGAGHQIRDWIHVDDHARALYRVLTDGRVGETYNIGGENEIRNIDLVQRICTVLDRLIPGPTPYADLIQHVTDRPGHDRRYAISNAKIAAELDWRPEVEFDDGLAATVAWYANQSSPASASMEQPGDVQ